MTTARVGSRLRRSVLYMPGSNARALDKARQLPVDGIIMDLEDAVAPEAKHGARKQVLAEIAAGGYGDREVIVRVNGLDTDWGDDDVAAAAGSGADAILIPKVATATDLARIEQLLDRCGAPAGLPLWIMVETPRGVLDLDSVLRASSRIGCVVMGTSDLSRELRVPHTPGRLGFLAALSHCVLAARAAGVDILDGVQLDLGDARGLALACEQGRNLGFDGKTLIHPSQVEAANAAFSPSGSEVAAARRLLAEWQRARAAGQGIVVVDGRLVENLHVDEATRLLAMADAIARRGY